MQQTLMTVVLLLQVISALAMIGLVLVQHGKGADMGASFGTGASGSLFGATGSANFLSRSTAVAATIFFAVSEAGRAPFETGTPSSAASSRAMPSTSADRTARRWSALAPVSESELSAT